MRHWQWVMMDNLRQTNRLRWWLHVEKVDKEVNATARDTVQCCSVRLTVIIGV